VCAGVREDKSTFAGLHATDISESAVLSDACRAWLAIEEHYASLTQVDLSRISSKSATDLTQLQALMATRARTGPTDVHDFVLLLDPRPSMRTFVESSGLLGNTADQAMGNTFASQAAQNALKHMSSAVRSAALDSSN
jgi:hypothetical protein